jgi:hypothetical protein
MGVDMYLVTEAKKPEIIALRLFQGAERQHQHGRAAALEILYGACRLGGCEDMSEFRV